MSFIPSKLDSGNSSTATLGSSATFTGTAMNALKYASVSIITNTDVKGVLLVDSGSEIDQVDHTFSQTLNVSAVTGEASAVLTLPVNAHYIKVRYINGTVAQSHFRLQTVMQAIPLVAAHDATIDGNNSSDTALGSSATFTGLFTDVTQFSQMSLIFKKDTTSSSTLHMDLSVDGAAADRTKSVQYPVGTDGGAHTLTIISRYFRVRIVNDSVAMSTLRLQTVLHPQKSKALTSTMIQHVSNRDDVTLVRDPTISQWDLARKFYDGKEARYFFGTNEHVGNLAWEHIWPNGGQYPFQSTAVILEVVCVDANDSGHSTATLTLAAQPSDADTFTMGTRVYTFQTTLTDVDGNIHIGASAAVTVLNIVDAINLGSAGEGVGVGYAASMTVHASVSAEDGAGDSVDFTSLIAYPQANNGNLEILPTTETGANLSFGDTTTVHPLGCHSIKLRGLDGTGADQTELVILNGTTEVQSTKSFLRINRVHVETVGTRGGANYDDINIQVTGGGDVLAVLQGFETPGTATYGHGEADLGMYTVPLGKVAYIVHLDLNIADTRKMNVALFVVDDCLNTNNSFQARRIIWGATQIVGGKIITLDFRSFVKVKSLTDMFFRAIADTGADNELEVKCEFWLTDEDSKGR